tara:strand:+ start:9154 stop:9516 length:363 start_codon:yes stop_codon:yes gene_type:complete
MTEREYMNEAAGLVREHLWKPSKPRSPDGREWTMGRELNIWKILAKTYDPEHINGAITVARGLRPDWSSNPLSLRIFFWKTPNGFNATPFLSQCIGEWHKRQPVSHGIPKASEILDGMVE